MVIDVLLLFIKETPKETPGGIEFDANFPIVKRIEITGRWFNKKPRAVIEWNGEEFKRKMDDFKWLWRMLLLNSSIDRVVPDYPNDIPESLWPEGYLRRRKRELNLFLMQCHSLPWIKNYKVYYDTFLEINKAEWKRKRNEFDQRMIHRIKHKQETYDRAKDFSINDDLGDNIKNDDKNKKKKSIFVNDTTDQPNPINNMDNMNDIDDDQDLNDYGTDGNDGWQ